VCSTKPKQKSDKEGICDFVQISSFKMAEPVPDLEGVDYRDIEEKCVCAKS